MRAYRSCASARCGWRSRPFIATRSAASSCPLRRSASPSRKNTRLCGSCASWAESARISSAMGEHTRRLPRPLDVGPLRFLFGRTAGESVPLIPAFDRLGGVAAGAGRATTRALGVAGIDEHDDARALQAEQRLRDFEVRTTQLGCQAAHGPLAVDEREHFPLGRKQVELAAAALRRRRERRDYTDVRDAILDARPLVDAPCAFHQQRLDGNPNRNLGRDSRLRLLVEREVAFVPAHDLEDDFFDLEADLALDFAL